jgi:GNAT superfamily N-acetyltransferase
MQGLVTAPASSKDFSIRPIATGEGARCEAILRSVPEWFGIEESLVQYVKDTQGHPTWIAWEAGGAGRAAGFVTLRMHYAQAAEVHCIAVSRAFHRRGVGRLLMEYAEREARARGVRFLQVKTMGPSKPNAEYAQTRLFYLSIGYTELEEFIGLWGGLPALQLVKAL